ncbi:MAG TPA: serine/threonine-protein kinase [Polyangiaceae bacterium]|nr:serine/threonine-protein kinase [Polyangiaceae bacterium]
MSQSPVKVGDVVGGRYRIDRLLGAGSMGFVVGAWHLELDQPVALKLLNPDIFEQGEAAARFRRECRAAARVKSEHVCRVIDVGSLEQGAPYMVMELLDGNNLEEELLRRGALPVAEAVGYILEAVEAIAEAHAAGIVHRDLKPANLFIARRADRSRLLKVLDFGISKSMIDSHGPGDMSLTRTGVIIGSPLYMSPEQMRSTKDADTLSDIWALGAILFQLVTGRPPYEGESIPELCAKLFSEDAPPPSAVRAGLPAGLDAVLHRTLARDPTKRFQNVAELGAALLEFNPGCRVHVERARRVLAARDGRPTSVAPGPASSDSPTIQASVSAVALWGQLSGRERRRRYGLVAAVLVACGVGGFALWQKRGVPSAASENVATAPTLEPVAPIAAPAAAAGPAAVTVQPADGAVPSLSSIVAAASASEGASAAPPNAAAASVSATKRPALVVARPRGTATAAKADSVSITDFGGRR